MSEGISAGLTGADTTRIVQSYQDKLKEAVELLKERQYVYNGYNGTPCLECLCQEGETHNTDCKLNNFIRDNQ